MVLEQPVSAIGGNIQQLFVRGQRHDNVPIRNETFLLITDEISDEDCGHRLIVRSAAAVEVTVLFEKLERIDRPIFALGFDHIEMGKQEEGLARACAAQASYQVSFSRLWSQQMKIRS